MEVAQAFTLVQSFQATAIKIHTLVNFNRHIKIPCKVFWHLGVSTLGIGVP